MAIFKIARFKIRAEACREAELAMHDFATYVRKELASSSWSTYRDPQAPAHYISLIRADDPAADARYRSAAGTKVFETALASLLDGEVEVRDCELVTSSDLQRRHRR